MAIRTSREMRKKLRMIENSLRVGQQLITLRKTRNLTQGQIADMLGVDQTYISTLESGRRLFTATLIMRLAQALEIHVQELDTRLYFFESTTPLINLALITSETFEDLCVAVDKQNLKIAQNILERWRVAIQQLPRHFQPRRIESS